jgi:hypothetical protein
MTKEKHLCRECGDVVPTGRWALGYKHCLFCGEELARQVTASFCVAPLNKSNYYYIHNPETLKQLNPKRTES